MNKAQISGQGLKVCYDWDKQFFVTIIFPYIVCEETNKNGHSPNIIRTKGAKGFRDYALFGPRPFFLWKTFYLLGNTHCIPRNVIHFTFGNECNCLQLNSEF